MDNILKCAKAFQEMFNIVYNMELSCKKELISLQLDFRIEDFFHLVDLQYLKDLDDIEANKILQSDKETPCLIF